MSIPSIDLGPTDEGFTLVKIGDIEKKLDVYEENHLLLDAQRQAAGRPTEFYAAICSRLKDLGYGDVPQKVAYGFLRHVNFCVAQLNQLAAADGDAPAEAASEAAPAEGTESGAGQESPAPAAG